MNKAKKKTTDTRDIEVNWTINQQATNMRNRVREREGQIHIQHNYNPPGNVLNTEYQMQGWRGTPELADQKRRKKSHKERTLNKNGNGTLHHEDAHTCCSFIRALTCLFARKIPTMCSPLSPHYLRCILYSVLITSFMPCLVCLPRSALQCVFPFPAYRILSPFPLSLVHHTLFAHLNSSSDQSYIQLSSPSGFCAFFMPYVVCFPGVPYYVFPPSILRTFRRFLAFFNKSWSILSPLNLFMLISCSRPWWIQLAEL